MKVLWLCNIILPAAAKQMGVEASSKEGWLSGLADVVLANQKKNGIDLSVAFPMGNICVEEKHCENTPQGEWPQGRSIHWKEDGRSTICLLYTSDAADDKPSVDLGGRRIIKKIFFKQKTAYEIPLRLVGSEMCIRDRDRPAEI